MSKINEYVKVFKDNRFKVTTVYDHGFNVVVNDYQDIFIRPLDGKKCCAVLSYNSAVFRGVYINDEMRRKEIGFGEKSPEAVFKDISKRLIESPFCIDQYNYLVERKREDDAYENKMEENRKKLEALKLDLRQSSEERYSLYLKNGYGSVQVSQDSLSIELRSVPFDIGMQILKMLEGK